LTDVGNAERFAEQHGTDVRFCHAWHKWLSWDGRRWALDNSGEVMRRAKLTARSIYRDASNEPDTEQRKLLVKFATQSERRERLAAMIDLAQSEQPIPVPVDCLDSAAWLLNVENGTIDLMTGRLREHCREDFLTKLCPVEYPVVSGSDPHLWLSFLDRIFAGNNKLIGFLQRLVGMALVGEVLENILPIFYGSGANGKSVFLETICGMLGSDYAMTASTSLLMVDRMGRHPTERTDLHGRRFVAAIETGDGGRLSEETVKQLTSRESIRARRMREDFWEFKPSHSVFLATNHRPEVRGTDYGIWRRLRLVPFSVVIPEGERDADLANKLKSEWPLILRWAVAGCLDWQRNKLQAPAEVKAATDDYRADSDVLGEFIEERCIAEPGCEAMAESLQKYRTTFGNKDAGSLQDVAEKVIQVSGTAQANVPETMKGLLEASKAGQQLGMTDEQTAAGWLAVEAQSPNVEIATTKYKSFLAASSKNQLWKGDIQKTTAAIQKRVKRGENIYDILGEQRAVEAYGDFAKLSTEDPEYLERQRKLIESAPSRHLFDTQSNLLMTDPRSRATFLRQQEEGALAASDEEMYAEKEALFDALQAAHKKGKGQFEWGGRTDIAVWGGLRDLLGMESVDFDYALKNERDTLDPKLVEALEDYMKRSNDTLEKIEQNQRRTTPQPGGRAE
jgi:P4 family phage/plasmid primase-like protien